MSNRVLIVDDEPHIRRVMRMALESAGYEVSEAADGTAGLEQFGDGSTCSAVVLDQRMPGIDGLETLRRMKARSPVAPIVMVTAYASVQLAVDAMKLGATDFVQKPMTPDTLRKTVRAAVQARPAPDQAGVEQNGGGARPSVSRMTMNGFRLWPEADADPQAPHLRKFAVESPAGRVEIVQVEILPEAVRAVARATGRQFPLVSQLWACQTEKALSTYLWSEGGIPTGNHLRLGTLDLEALDLARRWEEHG
jgi:CheY-like chemotaxis protein